MGVKKPFRIISKRGEINVIKRNVAKLKRKYIQDPFITLIDVKWRWTLLVFALSFLISWLIFGGLWYSIVTHHGDLNDENLDNPHWEPCITNISDFYSCFLFSMETQQTIGYGTRKPTEKCPLAVLTMCLQCILGVTIQAFMVGVVFAKLSKPKKRTKTLLFSKNAVVCHRDGFPCLMFRVGDMRRTLITQAHVKAQIIRNRVTLEGEILPFSQKELKVYADNESEKMFLVWPMTIIHRIDQDSPLFKFSDDDFKRGDFEIVVALGGCVETTGVTIQARSSYVPKEILWGHCFEQVINFNFIKGEYEVDYSSFDKTRCVNIPSCSALELELIHGESNSSNNPLMYNSFNQNT
ncbi:ATP-sensitive inward rectifier potassium channel 12-like [Onthophagus taurus]|uniref:ATP-sensitive inward rectifier potassium channel 12-like n=1 Tax=Onthophagus taurus TaxID=166361 RepID=UPI000C1FDEFD|nr:ATP-sensitive inward rectifier potassium channel 12-like [Onthophagus taurus]